MNTENNPIQFDGADPKLVENHIHMVDANTYHNLMGFAQAIRGATTPVGVTSGLTEATASKMGMLGFIQGLLRYAITTTVMCADTVENGEEMARHLLTEFKAEVLDFARKERAMRDNMKAPANDA